MNYTELLDAIENGTIKEEDLRDADLTSITSEEAFELLSQLAPDPTETDDPLKLENSRKLVAALLNKEGIISRFSKVDKENIVLHWIIYVGDVALAKKLLENEEISRNFLKGKKKISLLSLALTGQVPMLNFLLEMDVGNPETPISSGIVKHINAILSIASRQGNLNFARTILEIEKVHGSISKNASRVLQGLLETLFFNAADKENHELIKTILSFRAIRNNLAENFKHNPQLLEAISRYQSKDVISIIKGYQSRFLGFINRIREKRNELMKSKLSEILDPHEELMICDYFLMGAADAELITLSESERQSIDDRLEKLSRNGIDENKIIRLKKMAEDNVKEIFFGRPVHIIKDEGTRLLPRSLEITDEPEIDLIVTTKRKMKGYATVADKRNYKDLRMKTFGGAFKEAGKPAYDFFTGKKYLQLMLKWGDDYLQRIKKLDEATKEVAAARGIKSEEGYIDKTILGQEFMKGRQGRVSIFTEFASRGNLRAYLDKKGKLSEKKKYLFIEQLLKGVKNIHDANLVHRDLKPENILVDKNKIRISDFGLIGKEGDGIAGTPSYIPPEGANEDARTNKKYDMWAVGVIIYVMKFNAFPDLYSNREIVNEHLKKGNLIPAMKYLYDDKKLAAFREQIKDDPLLSRLFAREEERINIDEALAIHQKQVAERRHKEEQEKLPLPPIVSQFPAALKHKSASRPAQLDEPASKLPSQGSLNKKPPIK